MIHAFIPGTKAMARVIRDAVEMTPYWTEDPATHQDPYENAAKKLVAAGYGKIPREQWSFTGRETHWGFTYLVWTRDDGKRWARWVQ